jgi:hypothetical protein
MRENLNFKATPIRKFKPMQAVEKADLTIPQEPNFETNRRAQLKEDRA